MRRSLFAELRRRNVFRAAVLYIGAVWAFGQGLSQFSPALGLPDWATRWFLVAAVIGFPFWIAFAWFFEFTPEGLKRESDVEPHESITRQTGRKLDFAIIGVLAVAVVLLLTDRLVLHQGVNQPAGTAIPEKSIAVLPFENLSADKGNEYFASGMQDEILTRLAGIGDLKVISRTSTKRYESHPDNLRVIASDLGVANILEGSVQKADDSVRINVQLIDARNDAHLWAQTYDRQMRNVFAVESEVAQQIAEVLKAQLSPRETSALAAPPTRNAAAYDQFLRAEAEARRADDSQSEDDFRRASEDYEKTIALDPDFALAHANLAISQLKFGWFVQSLTETQLAAVKASVDRAQALAPDLPQVHIALADFHYFGHRDYDAAVREFERAVQLAPSQADALAGIAYIHRRKGEWPQAVTAFEKALTLAPRDAGVADNFGETLTILRRFAEAEPLYLRALAIEPTRISALSYHVRNRLFGFGDIEGARRAVAAMPSGPGRMLAHDHGDVIQLTGALVYPDLFDRRFDDALRAWDAIPANTPGQRIERLSARAAILILARRQQEVQSDCAELETLLEAPGARRPEDDRWLTRLAWAQLCMGRKADAIRTAHQAANALPFERDALAGADQLAGLAQIDAQAGALDEAVELIGRLLALPAGLTTTVERLKRDPVFEPLRTDPRFRKLVADNEAAQPRVKP
jgi:TolB-like protein/Tfp pilus assembly protein PilF